MKRTIIAIIAITFVVIAAGCVYCLAHGFSDFVSGKESLRGSGRIVTRTFETGDFHAVRASSRAEVEIVRGDGPVTVNADDNVMEYIEVKNDGGTLFIGLRSDNPFRRLNDITFEVNVPAGDGLCGLRSSGAAEIVCAPVLTADDIELKSSGASKIVAIVKCSDCNLEVSGAATCEIGGGTERFFASSSGAANVKLVLTTDMGTFKTSGAAKLLIEGAGRTCSFHASGASKIRAGEFRTEVCSARASGSSKIEVDCTENLTADASGASKIIYTDYGGKVALDIDTSGAGSVSRR